MNPLLYRETQISKLQFILETKSFTSNLFLWGCSGAGKYSVLKYTVDFLKISPIILDLRECYSDKSFWSILWGKIANVYCLNECQCDNAQNFIHNIQSLKDSLLYIVIRNTQYFKRIGTHLIKILSKINTMLIKAKIHIIYISSLPVENYGIPLSFAWPYTIHFPNYTRDEAEVIVLQKLKQFVAYNYSCKDLVGQENCHVDESHLKEKINLLFSLFYPICKNLTTLIALGEKLILPNFYTGDDGDGYLIQTSDLYFKNLADRFTQILACDGVKVPKNGAQTVPDNRDPRFPTFPVTYKFISLAAYLASTNAPQTDDYYFSKGRKKRMRTMKEKVPSVVKGPKVFTAHRLTSIVKSISEGWIPGKFVFSVSFHSAIATLVTYGYLAKARSSSNNLDTQKYKCNLTLDIAKVIARDLDFDISSYLPD